LAKAGNDVSLITRGDHLEAIQTNGLKLIRPGSKFVVQVKATDDPVKVGPVDLVLFTVKTFHNRHIISALKPLMGHETSVLTLQNGVESHEQLGAVLGSRNILPGAFWGSCQVQTPGVIAEAAKARISFGEVDDSESLRALEIRKVFRGAGIETELSPDPISVIWRKFVVLSALAGITSASQTRIKELLQYSDAHRMFCGAMEEALAVGLTRGVNLPWDLAQQSLEIIDGLPDFQFHARRLRERTAHRTGRPFRHGAQTRQTDCGANSSPYLLVFGATSPQRRGSSGVLVPKQPVSPGPANSK